MSADQVMEGVPGDGEDRLAVELGIVQAVQQMNPPRSRRRETHAQATGVFGIATSGEGCGLFVSDLNQFDPVLAGPQGLVNSIDPVSGKAEYGLDAPFDEAVDKQIGHRFRHGRIPCSIRSMRQTTREKEPDIFSFEISDLSIEDLLA